jgi:DNA invertase Pin-like site-specific DNA recombinase
LKTLQRQATELRDERKGRRSAAKSAAGKKSKKVEDSKVTDPPAQDSAGEKQAPEQDKTIQDLAAHLESAWKEIEEAAKERPALTVLAAFFTGIVVGHIFSHR